MNSLPLARSVNIVLQETGNELLVYDLRINKAYCLNETARMIFNLCDGHKTISEISYVVSRKLKTPVVEELVLLTINDLKNNGLIEDTYDQSSQLLPEKNRREIIKRVGLASMVALPLICFDYRPESGRSSQHDLWKHL